MAVRIVACSARVDGAEGRVVDAGAALEAGELLAPVGEALGLARDLLGVDRVGLDPGAGAGFVVARPLERRLRVPDHRLEALPGARLAGDRPELVEGARLLVDLEGRRVAERGQGLGRLAPDEALEAGRQLVDPGDVVLLGREERLGGGEVGQVRRRSSCAS